MASRLQSPSSINTFKHCKRKYYYQYIEKRPTSKSIHTVRGNIVHSTLEHFFDINVDKLSQDTVDRMFTMQLQQEFIKQWQSYDNDLRSLDMTNDQLKFYFEESLMMIMNWQKQFVARLRAKVSPLPLAFKELTPQRELELKSETHQVRGFIDAIETENGNVTIVDYKTNKRSDIKDSIKLQLSIYCLLYQEQFGNLPDNVAVFFLRDKQYTLPVHKDNVKDAMFEIEQIHMHTKMTEKMSDYEKNVTPLCKWKTGQCDFYDICKPF